MKVSDDGYPHELVEAVLADDYDSPGGYTPSSLNAPVLQRALLARHGHEIVESVTDHYDRFMGQLKHALLERVKTRNPTWETEVRWGTTIAGQPVSAKLDLYRPDIGRIVDWKNTKASSMFFQKDGPKAEHVQQLNVQAEMARRNGRVVNEVGNILLFKDWSREEALASVESEAHGQQDHYPQKWGVWVPAPLWSSEQVVAWIEERIAAHLSVDGLADEEIPICSSDERWAKGEEFAVKGSWQEKGAKALRVFRTKTLGSSAAAREAAEDEASNQERRRGSKGGTVTIEHRPAKDVRCLAWCSAAMFCRHGREVKGMR